MIRRKKRKLQKKLVIITSISLLFVMTVGYAAFQTNLTINAKGKIINRADSAINMKGIDVPVVTEGDGLYKDTYEEGRYVYKGANPNNYITFNNEIWRILAVETDGTLKIMRKDKVENKRFDSEGYRDSNSNGAGGTYCAQAGNYGCNAWATSDNFVNGSRSGTVLKDAEINTYLNSKTDINSYYNKLSEGAKSLIQEHTWGIGPVTIKNADLAAQIQSENGIIWSGNIGLISVSDYLRANTNMEQCGTLKLRFGNGATCKTTDYIFPSQLNMWFISPVTDDAASGFTLNNVGNLISPAMVSGGGIHPALYLIPNITLSGEGTTDKPYTIIQ